MGRYRGRLKRSGRSFDEMKRSGGYILLEVIIAVTVFALAFVGLMRVLQTTQTAVGELAFDGVVMEGLQAALAEAKQRDLAEMALQRRDERVGILYETEVEALTVDNGNGTTLEGLYRLVARASYDLGRGPETRQAEVWIYRPGGGR